jgi:hypothetical protein
VEWLQAFGAAHVVEAIMALATAEGLALAGWHARTGRGVPPRDYALNLLSGLCLMAALRSALYEHAFVIQCAWLAAAGLAHGADLWRRWPRG